MMSDLITPKTNLPIQFHLQCSTNQKQSFSMNHDQFGITGNQLKTNDEFNNQNISQLQLSLLSQFRDTSEAEIVKEFETYRRNKPFIVKQSTFKKELSKRTLKDHEKIDKRLDSCKNIFEKVKKLLQTIFGKWQIGQFREISMKIANDACLNIDHLAKRYNKCLICWFCENWNDVVIILLNYAYQQSFKDNLRDKKENTRLFNILNMINEINNTCELNQRNRAFFSQLNPSIFKKDLPNIEKLNANNNQTQFFNNYNNNIEPTILTKDDNDSHKIHESSNTQPDTNNEIPNKLMDNVIINFLNNNDNNNIFIDLDNEFPDLYKEFY